MLSSCLKCRKNTKNGRTMASSNCAVCVSKKSKFIKEHEASEVIFLNSAKKE